MTSADDIRSEGGHGTSILGDALRGAIAGAIATWAMGLVTRGLQSSQSKADAEREADARPNGRSSTGNLVRLLSDRLGLGIDAKTAGRAAEATHYALGVVPGAIYGALRGRVPGVAAARGLAYGTIVFAANDEVANTALGLSGPIEDYPLSTHVRGLVGHLALGLVTDAGLDLLGAARRSP